MEPELSVHERRERDIPPAARRFVLERDNYQCVACGTSGENKLQLHHWFSFRSQGGGHDAWNLVTLCFRCHHEVHAGALDVELREWKPGQWAAFCRRPWRMKPNA